MYPGKVFYVDSTYGSNSQSGAGAGVDPNYPFQTITKALSECVHDHGDAIVVRPGYNNTDVDNAAMTVDTYADETPITVNKRGVTILFSGFDNYVAAIDSGDKIFDVTVSDVTIKCQPYSRLYVKDAESGSTSTVVAIATGAEDVEIADIFTDDDLDGYDEVVTIAADAHNAYIHDCYFIGNTTDTDEGIVIEGTTDGVKITDNVIYDCGAANGGIYSGSIHTKCLIKNNYIDARTAGKKGINFTANATGEIIENWVYASADTNCIVNGHAVEFRNECNDAFTTNSFPSPAVGTVT
jgi:hypothetical protein